ncbi:MAG: FAD-dependent oxidoreductase [Acidobacteriota bacterium]
MDCEVIVVGGGIGGLTVAALLSARGADVCLLERQSHLGGCVASFEHGGYSFEPTAGLYSGWEAGGIYETIFSELRGRAPEVRQLTPSYLVRLSDQTEISLSDNFEQVEAEMRRAFPECDQTAFDFYRNLADSRLARPDEPMSTLLSNCSPRFRGFIDAQLQTFIQSTSDNCSYARAVNVLSSPLRGLWTIRGGGQALANALADSLKQSGGRLRLDTPVLRLAYGSDGVPVGVDLLSGERVSAKRAIVSNLTVWDTYGKLISPGRTPSAVSRELRNLHACGNYLLFLGMDTDAAKRLQANTRLVLTDWENETAQEIDQKLLVFAAAPDWDTRAPEGKLAVTVTTYTEAEDWFSFHDDESSHERQDQAALEAVWTRLHQAMPELGDSVEVIETSTPRTVYETTRRKFGMTGKLGPCGLFTFENFGTTVFPNVFMVGDTVSNGWGLEGICLSAVSLVNKLTK